ncbi:arginase family protein, partial [Staphylococcus aureus]
SIKNERLHLDLGEDNLISGGIGSARNKHYNKLGVIWDDAHGDLNISEESLNGINHGMQLRILTGEGPKEL